MGVCETGINSQFRAVLQEYKKDSDWIKNELSKARCNTLHELHLQYQQNRQTYLDQIAQFFTEDTHNVHTLNTLTTSANEADLGITIEAEISDAFAYLFPTNKTIAFFQEHYPARFRNYEKQSIETLTNYYLGEIASTLGINSAAWAASKLTIPSDQISALVTSIDGHFQGVDTTEGYIHSFGTLSADGASFTLKTKHDIEVMIKQLVRNKLVVDGYYVSVDEVAENPDAHQNIRIKKGIERDDLLAVHHAFKQEDLGVMHKTLKQHVSILTCYPELALSQLHKKPALISVLPVELKNDTRFTDVVATSLNDLTHIISDNFNWHQERIETQEFIAHVNQLNPLQLLNIIEQRKQAGLAPLPFFEYDGAIRDLKQFHAELNTELTSDWNQSPLAMRRRACEQADFSWLTNPQDKKNAVTYLAKTNTWFAGFTQYHAYQTSFDRLWQDIILIAKACFRLARSLLSLGIDYAAFTWLVPMISSLIQPIFWPLFLIGLALLWTGHESLTFTGLGLWFVAFLPWLSWAFFGLDLIGNTAISAYNAYDVVCALCNTLRRGFDMITATLSSLGVSADRHNTLENTCENILIRLDSIDAVSAQEKSEVLRTLLSRVKEDVRAETRSEAEAEPTFAGLLERKYSLFYHGEEHQVSFSEVSRMRRGYDDEFQLEETSSIMRFFSGRTTSEAMMATAEAASLAA